jgi:hypothetical protein
MTPSKAERVHSHSHPRHRSNRTRTITESFRDVQGFFRFVSSPQSPRIFHVIRPRWRTAHIRSPRVRRRQRRVNDVHMARRRHHAPETATITTASTRRVASRLRRRRRQRSDDKPLARGSPRLDGTFGHSAPCDPLAESLKLTKLTHRVQRRAAN